MSVGTQLLKLFTINPSSWIDENPYVLHEDKNSFLVFVSYPMGGLHDMIEIHEALDQAGLIQNNKHPSFDHGVETTDGHFPLGFQGNDGNFCGRVAFSDNAAGRAEVDKGFSFEISFGDKSEEEILSGLSQAAKLITTKRDAERRAEQEAEEKRAALAMRDNGYETIARALYEKQGRNAEADEATVAAYLTQQIQKTMPGSTVEIFPPEDAFPIKMVYGVDTQDREVKIHLPPDELEAFKQTSWDETCAIMHKLSAAMREKLPLTRTEFCSINGVKADGLLYGRVTGSSTKLATELSGELEAAISSRLLPPAEMYSEAERPSKQLN